MAAWYDLLVTVICTVTGFSLFINVPFYILVLVAIIKNKKNPPFSSPFFTIFVALGFVDLCCYFLYCFIKKPIFFGYVPSFTLPYNVPNKYCQSIYAFFYIAGFMQYQLLMLLTINRGISFASPTLYRLHCTELATKIGIAVIFVTSTCLAMPMFFIESQISQYTVELDGQEYVMQTGPVLHSSSKISVYIKYAWMVHVALVVIIGVFTYLFIFFKLGPFRASFKEQGINIEKRLLGVGAAICFFNMLFIVYFIYRDYIADPSSHVHEWILLVLSDIYDLPGGIILWFTCKDIKRVIWLPKFLRKFKFFQAEESHVIVYTKSFSSLPSFLQPPK